MEHQSVIVDPGAAATNLRRVIESPIVACADQPIGRGTLVPALFLGLEFLLPPRFPREFELRGFLAEPSGRVCPKLFGLVLVEVEDALRAGTRAGTLAIPKDGEVTGGVMRRRGVRSGGGVGAAGAGTVAGAGGGYRP